MNRRSFLMRAGAAAIAVVGVPLFIPAERLDFGVPKRLVVPEPAEMFQILSGEVEIDQFRKTTIYLPVQDWGPPGAKRWVLETAADLRGPYDYVQSSDYHRTPPSYARLTTAQLEKVAEINREFDRAFFWRPIYERLPDPDPDVLRYSVRWPLARGGGS